MPGGARVLPSRVSVRVPAFVVLLASAVAFAQPIDGLKDDQWVHTRAFATFGVATRESNQEFPEGATAIAGAALPRLLQAHLSGAFFPRRSLGVGFELHSDFGRVRQESTGLLLGQQTFKTSIAFAARWQPLLLLALEAHLGWGLGRLALIRPLAPPTAEFRLVTGPVVGVAATFDPTVHLTAQLYGRLETSLVSMSGASLTLGAQARYGLLELGPVELGLAASLEFYAGGWEGGGTVTAVNEGAWRVGLGPSLVGRRPAPVVEALRPAVAPSVVGRVTRADGAPLAGAKVSAVGREATTDAEGAFVLEGLPSGPVTLEAAAPAFKSASKPVVVTPGVSVEVALVLQAKTGPGRITGVVRAGPTQPLGGAKVTSGATSVRSSATGAFVLPQVGPGPVKVRVMLDGYTPADEVVQVPPEGAATLDVTLEVATSRTKAKIRGIVSSAAGPVAKATVRIVELKLKQSVKADGRFEAEVPGGRYTVVIEAARYATQTRVVEVADGDQAIFQIDLEQLR